MAHRSAVLWDNDGVLVDTEHLYFRATRDVLASIGIELTEEQFIEVSLRLGRSAFDLASERGIDPQRIELLREARNAAYSNLLLETPLVIDGARETLARLHGRIVMGVVTSSRREHFDIIHRASGLLPYFDFVITREDYERSKPHPDPYLTAIERHRLDPSACVVVEDSERGLASATAAGLRCLVVPNRLTRGGDFRRATGVLGSLGELTVELLRRIHLDADRAPRDS